MKKNLKLEWRNKYTDKLLHMHVITADHEIRLCDDLITYSCTLPKGRYSIGTECKKCLKRLDELIKAEKVTKASGRYELNLSKE